MSNSGKFGKEELLEKLKDVVLTLKRKSSEIKNDRALANRWNNKYVEAKRQIDKLSPEDMIWFSQEYSDWFEKEIRPSLSLNSLLK